MRLTNRRAMFCRSAPANRKTCIKSDVEARRYKPLQVRRRSALLNPFCAPLCNGGGAETGSVHA